MPLLEPITFLSAPARRADSTPVTLAKAEDVSSCSPSSSPEFRSMTHRSQPLVMPSGVNSLSRSDPPTPPRGPPPTPRRRAHSELSRSDPPTPPRGPPPTPRRRDQVAFNSLSRRDPPSPPNGPPPTPRRHKADIFNSLSRRDPPSPPGGPPPTPDRNNDYDFFNSLSRRDPPTPPRGPPPSPCRRNIFNDLSRRDPPTPPRGPPPSPGSYDFEPSTGLSRSNPPSPPRGPPPTPKRCLGEYSTWTPDETNLLTFVCRSGVELGWYQIAGLFHGKDVDVCRSKYREIQHSEQALLDQLGDPGSDGDDSKSFYRKPLQLCIPTDEVPGLSPGPSPVGSPVCDRRTIRSFISDVECAVELEMPKKTKAIAHLSDELNFALGKEWDVKDRVQGQHAFPPYPAGVSWAMAPGFLQMAD